MAGHRDHRDRAKMRVKDRDRLRAIIEAEDIILRLNGFATSTLDQLASDPDRRMTSDQISTSFGLLKKVLPDLSSVELMPNPESAADLTDEQLADMVRAAGIGDRSDRTNGNGRLN